MRARPNSRYEVALSGLVFRFGVASRGCLSSFRRATSLALAFVRGSTRISTWLWLFCYVLRVQFKDSKDVARETAAEEQNVW